MTIYNIQFAPTLEDLDDTKYGLAQGGTGVWRIDGGIRGKKEIIANIRKYARKHLHEAKKTERPDMPDFFFVRAYKLYYLDSYTGAGVWQAANVEGTIK
jgi:hypothetical protein